MHPGSVQVGIITRQIHQLKTFLGILVFVSNLRDDLCMNSDFMQTFAWFFYRILGTVHVYRSLEVWRQYRASV